MTNQTLPNERVQFKKISTGNGYQNDLIATMIDRLELTVDSLQHLRLELQHQLVTLQLDIVDLTDTIKDANSKNDKLQKWFLTLAIVGTLLTATQLVQVWDILVRGIGK